MEDFDMMLFHGSNTSIDSIDLTKGRRVKILALGFYLRDNKEQQESMKSCI